MTDYRAVTTLAGQAKIAGAIAGTAPLHITTLAVGDGNGNPVTPLVTMTSLVHEVWRGDVISVARDPLHPNQVIVNATIPAEAGPFMIRELCLIDADGDVLAIMNYPQTEKTAQSQNVVTTLDVQFVWVVDTAAAVSVYINPASLVSIAGLLRAPFIAIDAFAAAPPANPTAGALVVVAANPTGVFAGHVAEFAMWAGEAWVFAPAGRGTIVALPDDTYWRRTAAGWSQVGLPTTEYPVTHIAVGHSTDAYPATFAGTVMAANFAVTLNTFPANPITAVGFVAPAAGTYEASVSQPATVINGCLVVLQHWSAAGALLATVATGGLNASGNTAQSSAGCAGSVQMAAGDKLRVAASQGGAAQSLTVTLTVTRKS